MADAMVSDDRGGLLSNIFFEIIRSPINIALVGVITLLVYKILKSRHRVHVVQVEPELPKLKKRDFTVEELRKYDGTGPDGRILVAVDGKVFDVTRGKRFYGPGGPYSAYGGRDASRGLATFSVTGGKEGYDDLSDLNSMEMESVKEWAIQFTEKYDYVGRLLKPGEEPTNYSDEEEEPSQTDEEKKNKSGSGDKTKDE
ncbi:membrane-associated progesterone receptor component 1-like [Lycorma delicatula]|uniref:membrane-associated progesterone receptor component 1-like n=1 Tax=Lycorma delicatula TaxID=130591 RepID=UPI003F514928